MKRQSGCLDLHFRAFSLRLRQSAYGILSMATKSTPVPKLKSAADYQDLGAQILNDEPIIAVVDDFIPIEETQIIAKLARGELKPASVASEDGNVMSDVRRSSIHFLPHDSHPVVTAVGERISRYVGLPHAYAEHMQIVHYSHDQEYEAHMDTFDPNTPAGWKYWNRGGQRLVTALCYIEAPDQGGATGFPNLDLEVAAKPGRMVIFHSCKEGTIQPDERALHAGCPVISGQKLAFNFWFRQRPFGEHVPVPNEHQDAARLRNNARSMVLNKKRQDAAKKHPLLSR